MDGFVYFKLQFASSQSQNKGQKEFTGINIVKLNSKLTPILLWTTGPRYHNQLVESQHFVINKIKRVFFLFAICLFDIKCLSDHLEYFLLYTKFLFLITGDCFQNSFWNPRPVWLGLHERNYWLICFRWDEFSRQSRVIRNNLDMYRNWPELVPV